MSTTTTAHEEVKRLRMSYEAYLDYTGDTMRTEWVDGEVLVYMPPKDEHQRLVEFLYALLALFVRLNQLGLVRLSPFEVKLWENGPAREPDLFFVRQENLHKLSRDRLSGAPDLVIEVLSKSTMRIDRNDKFREYERAGVKEYWLFDARPGFTRSDFFRLDDKGRYDLYATEVDEMAHSSTLDGFWLRPAWLWQTPHPDPLQALAEIVGKERLLVALGEG